MAGPVVTFYFTPAICLAHLFHHEGLIMPNLPIQLPPRANYLPYSIFDPTGVEKEPEALLAGFLLSHASEVHLIDRELHDLSSADFQYEDTAIIFDTCMSALDERKAFASNAKLADGSILAPVLDKLNKNGCIDAVKYANILASASWSFLCSPALALSWIDMIKERSAWRKIAATASYMMEVAVAPGSTKIKDFMADTASTMQEILEGSSSKQEGDNLSLICSCVNLLKEIQDNLHNGVTHQGLLTGFPQLDRMLDGLKGGKLYILAARPSVGKTALALNILINIAQSKQITKPILFFSVEMSQKEIAARTLSSFMHASVQQLSRGDVTSGQWSQALRGVKSLGYSEDGGKSNISLLMVDDTGNITPNILASQARRVANTCGGLSMIVVDYIQLMVTDDRRGSANRNLEVAQISRQLKLLSKEYDCPVLALSQLNRQPDNRSEPAPQLSDLRDSGAIEQDADVVMFLYKPTKDSDWRKLSIAKNRSGEVGDITLDFKGAWTKFTETTTPPEVQ